jgi:molybdopterin-guanine dinucleotide biosynthesis protein B
MKLKLKSSHRIVDDRNRIVMAEGRMQLLEAIVQTGSINQAAKQMGMSYKSAWSKIRSTEAHFKAKIVHSDKATGTRLTSTGRELLYSYLRMKQQCLTADDAIFQTHFHPDGPQSTAQERRPPILSFVGHSGSGKTTFIEKLIPVLTQTGIKVAVIKHDVHGFEMDKPGKDTWRHKKAGAAATIISSSNRIGLVMDSNHDHQPHELVPMLGSVDLIITEGYKRGPYPKVEVFRPDATGDITPVCKGDPKLIAVVSDADVSARLPVFGLDEIEAVAAFIARHFQLNRIAELRT